MEVNLIYSCLSILICLLAVKVWFSGPRKKNLPPSPVGLPIVGHLHLLKEPLHRTLHSFSQKYGPIFSLRFGSRFVLVVSSPSAVEECFTKNDIVFANRPYLILGKYVGYDFTIMGLAPYGDHWRNLRRLGAVEIFSSHRLNLSLGVRSDETKMLLHKLYKACGGCCNDFAKVELKSMFSELSFNLIMRIVAGKRYYGEDVSGVEEAEQFRELVEELFELSGAAYPGDFLPIFRWVDYNGYMKRTKRLSIEIDRFFQSLVVEQRRNKGNSENANNMISHLLSLQESEPEYYTDKIIKGLIQAMLVAGTHTSAATLEWAMANLLNHPQILNKARDELDIQLGSQHLIHEHDLSKLPYLQNIISETLRLFPAAPLLVPHMASSDCVIGGYDIPRGTMLLVNAWAIQRDPKYWDDAVSFKPERFESMNGREGEEAYKMLPFGVGRRACPGAGLANRMIGLALGSLIQCFDWERVGDKDIDMAEGKGLTMPKAEPLEALCKPRPVISNFLLHPAKTD